MGTTKRRCPDIKGFLERIETTDFRKPFKGLIIIALVVVIVCGALTAFMFRTQLTELYALDRMEGQTMLQGESRIPMTEYGHRWHSDDREIDVFDAGLVTHPSTGAIITAITSIVLCSLYALVYWLMVAAWLYKASAKAGMNRAFWSILGLAFNVLAVLAFLVVRSSLVHCQNCGAWQKSGKFCVSCGEALGLVCPKCGKMSKASDKFCPDCGTVLTSKGMKGVQS